MSPERVAGNPSGLFLSSPNRTPLVPFLPHKSTSIKMPTLLVVKLKYTEREQKFRRTTSVRSFVDFPL